MKLQILASYFYIRGAPDWTRLIDQTSDDVDWLIDSGAFSDYTYRLKAAKIGRPANPVAVDDYMEWIRQREGRLWQYIALDVIMNKEGTEANLARMLDAGLRPMPVLISTQPATEAGRLARINPHVAIGGAVTSSKEWIRHRLVKVKEVAPGIRSHALGYVKWPEMLSDPLYSVDSSSWMNGSRFGQLLRFSPGTGLTALDPTTRTAERFVIQQGGPPRSGLWRGSLGVLAMFTGNAHLALQRYLLTRDIHYFMVLPNTSWMCSLLACVACASDSRFNYVRARSLGHKLREKLKSGTLVQEAIPIIKDYAQRMIL